MIEALLATVVSAAAFLMIPMGLPSLWVIACCGLVLPYQGEGWMDVGILAAAALVAEVMEFGGTMHLAKKTGASKSGLLGAVLGGFIGGIVLTPVFPPVGTLFGAALGAFAGAFFLELAHANRQGLDGLRSGWGAFLGTLVGRFSKIVFGLFQCVWLLRVLWF
ncbi:MAG: DUF456 domain-containing protein [Planctomycetes bacterium]|nr:DUF456 domain-containing protein [Planctomycetota bacterium]